MTHSKLASIARVVCAIAFHIDTLEVVWQSEPSREKWGPLISSRISDFWPADQLHPHPGPYSVTGPSPSGPVRVSGWQMALDGEHVLSVVERVEPLETRADPATLSAVDEAVKLAALRAVMRRVADTGTAPTDTDPQFIALVRDGADVATICAALAMSPSDVELKLIQISRAP